MSAQSSETTGFQKPAAVLPKPIGEQPGATGAVALSRPEAARKLATQRVAVTDQNLEASLRSRCNVGKRLRSRVLPGEPDTELVPVRPGEMDLASASSMVDLAFQDWTTHPDGDRIMDAALAYCEALTKRRADDAAEVTAQAYKSALARYPMDVALQVLREWPERNPWFPSWSELRDRCEKLTAPRMDLLEAIRLARLS